MAHSFIAYIDESGDDGIEKFREPGGQGGASKWLCICACIMRSSQSLETVKWRDEIKTKTGKKGDRTIHFATLNHGQKKVASQLLSTKPVRFISSIVYKPAMRTDIFTAKNQLYFYMTRYVIERLSWFCRDMRRDVPEGDGRLKIIFSRRGGMSYDDFRSYLDRLRGDADKTNIHWPVIDIGSIEALDHSKHAGLQLADCGASAIASALEPDLYGNVEAQYLHQIQQVIYARNGNYLGYGLKLLPSITQLALTPQQAQSIQPFK